MAEKQLADGLRVTIITATYNQGRYIGRCIESVLNQTHQNFEYLIYDGCSTDNTESVIAPYLADLRIIYCRQPDSGQADAINKGLEAARGDIVCWLNSDDFFFDHEVLTKVCRAFAADEKIDAVAGDGYAAHPDGTLSNPIVLGDASRISYSALRIANSFLQPATFWRRNEIRLDESLHFVLDWKFFLSFYRTGRSFHYLPEFLAVYRLHDASKTMLDSAARRQEIYRMLEFIGAGWVIRGWAWFIYCLYVIAETLRFPPIKRFAHLINVAMWHLSRGKVFSS